MEDLFDSSGPAPDPAKPRADAPLAERMRPRTLEDLVGQEAAIGEGTALRAAIREQRLPSLLLWGPPGCGKTTLASCLARAVGGRLLAYSAVRVGVKELKGAMAEAARLRNAGGRAPILFLDEIHRFNKSQQDALLPAVEAGDVTLIGATTENPSFEVNSALLSRCRVVVLEALGEAELVEVLQRALRNDAELSQLGIEAEPEALHKLAQRCGGDARFALGSLELAVRHALDAADGSAPHIDTNTAEAILAEAHLVYDKAGEEHFNLISALHKSLRNSDAQAGIYWLGRLLEGGEDPMYIARRLVRFASEDVGLADPQALLQTEAAAGAVARIGMPECALALAQATVYLAQAPKSNALYTAYKAVQKAIRDGATDSVPHHLRNAPTKLMKELGYGHGYHYAHDEAEGVAQMRCLPESMGEAIFYRPTDHGFEAEAAERLRDAYRRARSQPNAENHGDVR